MEQIPLVDLKAQFNNHREEILRAVQEVIESTSFIQGPFVEKFSQHFLKHHGRNFGLGCYNGTTVISLALRALGVGPGDEVLIPHHTFFGTAEPVVEVGATSVLVHIVGGTYSFDLEDLQKK